MYNFDNQQIPQLLPVSLAAQLKPWFTSTILDEGLELIRQKKIGGFSCIRNATGALVGEKATVTLQFAKSTTLHQGFFIETRHCGLCRLKTDEKGCAHMAALAIQSLTLPAGEKKPVPIPRAFAGSNWQKIGNFLHDWLYRGRSSAECIAGEDFTLWQMSPPDGGVQVNIPASWQEQGEFLLRRQPKKKGAEKPDSGLALLHSQLRLRVMTDNERALESSGNSSVGWQKDTSFWTWLARMLFMFHGDRIPEFSRDPSTGRFTLRIGRDTEAGALILTAPREKVWEMVRTLPLLSEETNILPVARECFQVIFNNEDRLEVIPSLALADGRILGRKELAEHRFSSAYYLPGEGFLPTSRLPAEGILKNPEGDTGALPLFGFMQNEKTRNEPFTVAANDIPAFLESNRKSLRHPDNIVSPELLHLQVRELPDRLVIDSFEEHDDWCYLSCHYGLGNTSITLNDILAAREQKLSYLPGREWLQLDDSQLSWLYDLAENRLAGDGSGKIRLSYREVMSLTALMPETTIAIKGQSSRKRLAGLLDTACWTDDAALTEVPGHLRSYQRHGLAWLNRLFRLGIGGLLADDMGLGKTHQGLALLRMAVRESKQGLMLVICPASVVLNWAEKIDGYYQDLPYAVYYGQQRDLAKARERRVILTTYGIVRQDLEQLRLCSFDIILLDEIQHLKNRTTSLHKAVAELNSRVKIGLTGTPIENSLQDLRSLFDICLPGFLGSEREFNHNYVIPITEDGNTETRDRLGRLIHPFILRRSRGQVLTELPEIIEDNRICELSDDQVSLYREVLAGREEELEELADDTAAIPYMNILATITRLKQICCHPCLVQGCDDPEEYGSGKWDLFVELAEELLAANMKFVVFSQYTSMIGLIENHLQAAGIGFACLKGDMPVGRRQKMINTFNTDPDCRVFCASLLAGGVGIDLTSAQAVIHYDRWWNPAREEQATARVHRMGQKHVVQVFRLITRGTLEEKIHNLIRKKSHLASSLIQEDEAGIIKQMDRRQLAELLSFSS